MMISAVLLVLITMLNSQICWSNERRIYCIKSDDDQGYSDEACPEDHFLWLWSNVTQNYTEYFTSHREIYFLPGIYKLDNNLAIMHVTDLSLIGFGDAAVTLNCTTDDAGVVSLYNSSFVKFQNITLINCGMPVNTITKQNISFPSIRAALFACNVSSVTLTNVIFENTQGHGILIQNALKEIVIKNVAIKYTIKVQDIAKEYNAYGIVIIYNDDVKLNTRNYQHGILIKNCHFINLRNVNKMPPSLPASDCIDSVVICLAFNQTYYNVSLQIQGAYIENVTSNYLSLISISYRPFSQTTVNFTNSLFINNSISTAKGYSMFNFQLNNQFGSMSDKFLYILINGCKFYKNKLSIWNSQNKTYVPLKVILRFNEFKNNTGVENNTKLWILKFRYFEELTIQDCKFISNANSTLVFKNITTLRFVGRSIFQHNLAVRYLLLFDKTYPQFNGYYEFSYNVANTILNIYRYITLSENTTINITNNGVSDNINNTKKKQKVHWAPVHVGTRHTLFQCSFQFNAESNQVSNIHIILLKNTYYSHAVFGTQMNSCYWHKKYKATPGEVYSNTFVHDELHKTFVGREGAMLCYCKNDNETDCFKDHLQSIFPGQIINISVTLLKPIIQTAVHVDPSGLLNNSLYPPCVVPSSKVYLISNKCTVISFRIKFKSLDEPSCSIYLKTTSIPETLFIYYFDHMQCPLGFQFINGSCDCDPRLKAVFPSLKCDIDNQVLNKPWRSWIGTSYATGNDTLYYVEDCVEHFCSSQLSNIQLHSPDSQCVNSRVGITCGHCPVGLDSVFGSFNCKKCSSYWLLLLPAFILAGILLVFCLFLLNITVVHGSINGFILYANILVGNNYSVFPKGNVLFVLLSLLNLDLGIETCFYHGMTEYDKTWIQFTFPVYLLLIVVILVFASRYSSFVERVTRRRVIPVIATIFLLSYSKLLLATTKVLFSYKTVHRLDDGHKQSIWMWDSSIPLVGIKFFSLFIVCLLVFMIILVPFNFIMLFTRFFFHFKFIVSYIKPYADAYQAPFKDRHRYFFGLELVVRSMFFTLGNRILNTYQTVSLSGLTCTLYLIYLCIFQPFKTTANNALYISYGINAVLINFVLISSNFIMTKVHYIMISGLVLFAILQFGGTLLHRIYVNHFERNVEHKSVIRKILDFIMKHLPVENKHKTNGLKMAQLSNEDSLQEELLIVE